MILKLLNPLNLFQFFYAKFYVWFTFFLVNWATKRVRKLMCKIGKNPDHEVPPPPPPPPPKWDEADINRAWMVDTKERGPVWMAVVNEYQSYVKNPAEHPVLRSRAAWEEKQKKTPTPEVAETPQAPLAPTITDLEAWRSTFEEAQYDKDFKIFTHEGVDVTRVEEAVKSEKKE